MNYFFSNISIYGQYFTCSFNVMILTKITSLLLFPAHEHDNVKMINKYLKSILKYLWEVFAYNINKMYLHLKG